MIAYSDIPGVVIKPLVVGSPTLPRGAESCVPSLRIDVTEAAPVDASVAQRVEQAWREHQRLNPREFDGPILHIHYADSFTGRIDARREQYRHLAVGLACGIRVKLLAVAGLVTAIDQDGEECLLLGRRSTQTRIYGGQWELAPSGGVSCPPPSTTQLSLDDVHAALLEEAREELSENFENAKAQPLALVADQRAMSEDILLGVKLPSPIDSRFRSCKRGESTESWEYADTAWVPTSRLGGWLRAQPDALIPPSLAVLRWLGWV